MPIFQQYYTSFLHPTDMRHGGGYGVQAETAEIPLSAKAMIEKTIGYRIPRNAVVDAIDQHPIALRFQAQKGQAILTCVRSSGKDELGRDGNYFAHSLIGSTEDITKELPPIFYWKSDFWVIHDDRHFETLPALNSMSAVAVSFDPNELWDFVKEGSRLVWFQKLLSAVIDYERSRRAIVILDTNDAIARWIACVTMALPPMYHPYLSFATYHHDPYAAPFMLIGTTSDSLFRFNSDEYIRYFVLNAETSRISEAPPSDYADFIVQRFNPAQFDTEIVDLFDWLDEYPFVRDGNISKLDNLLNFRQATFLRTLPPASEKCIRAASMIIEVSSGTPLSTQRLNDLRAALDIVATATLSGSQAISYYLQAAQLLRSVDRDFTQTSLTTALLLGQLVLQKRSDDAAQVLRLGEQLYGVEIFTSAMQSSSVRHLVAEHLDPNDSEQVNLLWAVFGKSLKPPLNQLLNLQPILHKTFLALDEMKSSQLPIPEVARNIIVAVLDGVSNEDFQTLLKLAAAHRAQNPTSWVLEWIYYLHVSALPLSARSNQPYSIIRQTFPTLFRFELCADLARSNQIEDILSTIVNWCIVWPSNASQVITEGLEFLWKQPNVHHKALSRALLLHPTVEPHIPAEWRYKLIESSLSEAKITELDESTVQLYIQILAANLKLSPTLLGAIEGSLALTKRVLNDSDVVNMQRRWETISEQQYRADAGILMDKFFNVQRNVGDQHRLLIHTAYASRYRHVFWELYWTKLRVELVEKRQAEAIAAILDIWFRSVTELEVRFPMIVPEFFLELPDTLTAIRETKGYGRIERELHRSIVRFSWHPLVTKHLAKTRRGILNLF